MASLARNRSLTAAIRPYFEAGPLGALALGMASGTPYTMIAATLTTRLAESGIDKKSVTAFGLALLVYSFKPLWAPVIDRGRIPVLAGLIGQRRAWLVVCMAIASAAIAWLGVADPNADLAMFAAAAVAVGFAGATLDIVIDAIRIEWLREDQMGAGSGMTQYGWRLGAYLVGAGALLIATRAGWASAYLVAPLLFLPALLAAAMLGEPTRPPAPRSGRGFGAAVRDAIVAPLADFLGRKGALVVLAFVLVHKLGDTVCQLSVRLFYNDLGFSKDEVAFYDVSLGLFGMLGGIFVGGILYKRLGLAGSVLLSLVLMAATNAGYALLAVIGHDVAALAAVQGFENFASGIGGVTIGAWLALLCDRRFTATQFALLSSAAAILGRAFSSGTAGALIETMGYVDFYWLTTALALPGILIFLWLWRAGLVVADDTVTATAPGAATGV
ncbi:AmpG family muropeptide MFS transporter [Sandarakinorhabdus rubra]|uniref:AmpG family muropeptide MFS transporter n=1 Tax=Sandarakinorhabdus rubra TaxID=2672568 RepID=UPI0013DD2AE9|nr:MFS transporter [Sandarakinorhabdus rubra]